MSAKVERGVVVLCGRVPTRERKFKDIDNVYSAWLEMDETRITIFNRLHFVLKKVCVGDASRRFLNC